MLKHDHIGVVFCFLILKFVKFGLCGVLYQDQSIKLFASLIQASMVKKNILIVNEFRYLCINHTILYFYLTVIFL